MIPQRKNTFPSVTTRNGRLSFRLYNAVTDAVSVHEWVRSAHARYWGMHNATLDEVRRMYMNESSVVPVVVGRGNQLLALAELYDIQQSPIKGLYDFAAGDLGMHILVKPPRSVEHGFTSCVFGAVMYHCFHIQGAGRVVVEPDQGNSAIRRKNTQAGFIEHHTVSLPDKQAVLSTCTLDQFHASFLSRYVLVPKPASSSEKP